MALEIGAKAPSFDLPATDGRHYSLETFADKAATVIVFSCNHCHHVQLYETRMMQLAHEYANQGVALIAINCNDPENYPEDSFEAMQARARGRGFNFLYLFDESQESAMDYGATITPEVFIVDAGGTVVYQGAFDDNPEDADAVGQSYVKQALDELLAKKPVSMTRTSPVGCTIKWRTGGCDEGCPLSKTPPSA